MTEKDLPTKERYAFYRFVVNTDFESASGGDLLKAWVAGATFARTEKEEAK